MSEPIKVGRQPTVDGGQNVVLDVGESRVVLPPLSGMRVAFAILQSSLAALDALAVRAQFDARVASSDDE